MGGEEGAEPLMHGMNISLGMASMSPVDRRAAAQCASHWQCTPSCRHRSARRRRAHATQLLGQLCKAGHSGRQSAACPLHICCPPDGGNTNGPQRRSLRRLCSRGSSQSAKIHLSATDKPDCHAQCVGVSTRRASCLSTTEMEKINTLYTTVCAFFASLLWLTATKYLWCTF